MSRFSVTTQFLRHNLLAVFDDALDSSSLFFFFNDPAPTEIYPLPPHAALPISPATAQPAEPHEHQPHPRPEHPRRPRPRQPAVAARDVALPARLEVAFGHVIGGAQRRVERDRKSTRLNSSHSQISYAVFCLKKK